MQAMLGLSRAAQLLMLPIVPIQVSLHLGRHTGKSHSKSPSWSGQGTVPGSGPAVAVAKENRGGNNGIWAHSHQCEQISSSSSVGCIFKELSTVRSCLAQR